MQAAFEPMLISRSSPCPEAQEVSASTPQTMTMQAPAAPAKAAQATASVAPVAAVGACVAAFGALAMVAHRRKRTRQFQAETTWETVGTVAFRDLARMICCVVHSLTRILLRRRNSTPLCSSKKFARCGRKMQDSRCSVGLGTGRLFSLLACLVACLSFVQY